MKKNNKNEKQNITRFFTSSRYEHLYIFKIKLQMTMMMPVSKPSG